MKLVMIFLLYNNLFIYQVLCTLIYRRRSLFSFLSINDNDDDNNYDKNDNNDATK